MALQLCQDQYRGSVSLVPAFNPSLLSTAAGVIPSQPLALTNAFVTLQNPALINFPSLKVGQGVSLNLFQKSISPPLPPTPPGSGSPPNSRLSPAIYNNVNILERNHLQNHKPNEQHLRFGIESILSPEFGKTKGEADNSRRPSTSKSPVSSDVFLRTPPRTPEIASKHDLPFDLSHKADLANNILIRGLGELNRNLSSANYPKVQLPFSPAYFPGQSVQQVPPALMSLHLLQQQYGSAVIPQQIAPLGTQIAKPIPFPANAAFTAYKYPNASAIEVPVKKIDQPVVRSTEQQLLQQKIFSEERCNNSALTTDTRPTEHPHSNKLPMKISLSKQLSPNLPHSNEQKRIENNSSKNVELSHTPPQSPSPKHIHVGRESPEISVSSPPVLEKNSMPDSPTSITTVSSCTDLDSTPCDINKNCLSENKPASQENIEELVNPKIPDDNTNWPAWVYCTRYSDRPSSGPRSRRVKRRDRNPEEKRPRTAFTSDQLNRLKKEFEDNKYLTEKRRQDLARDLGLNESQIKIWFQNKRAKIKKTSGSRSELAQHLMAQGLYNHCTVPVDEDEAYLA